MPDLQFIILLVILLIAIFSAYVVFGGFIAGAGYQPTPGKNLDIMFEYAKPDESKRVFDLGSGFGKIVIQVSTRFHSRCTGVEVDPLKVWWSRREIKRRGLEKLADIVRGNLLEVDLSSADIIFVFLWEGIMQKLRAKVLSEMKPGTVVVSYYHRFDDWEAEREDTNNKVFLYRIPAASG